MRYALDASLVAGRRVRRWHRTACMPASGMFATAAAVALVVAPGGSGIQVVDSPNEPQDRRL